MKKILGATIAITLAALIVLVAFRNYKASLYEDLPTAKIADIETSNLVMLFAGVGLVVVILVIVWAVRQSRHDDYYAPRADVITAGYTELPNYRAPVAQLAGPRYINVPTFHNQGVTQPIGAQAETILTSQVEDSTTHQTVELQVPLRYLYRFASLPTPNRNEWTGKPVIYGQALALFREHGFLDQAGGGYRWKDAYSKQARLDWLEQFNTPVTPDTHTREG